MKLTNYLMKVRRLLCLEVINLKVNSSVKKVINLSRRNLSSAEISLLSKGPKFVLTANKIGQAKLKRKLEEYGRKLRLMWHFRNDSRFPSRDLNLNQLLILETKMLLLKHI